MKYELHSQEQGFRKGLLFLSGRNKTIQSWNVTSTGKRIDLEMAFRKRVQTALVEFDEVDLSGYHQGGPDYTLEPLLSQLDPRVEWLVVASSLGAYFASLLPERLLLGMILIDPPARLARIDFKLPIRVHLKANTESMPDFAFWNRITSYNARSAVVVHWEASHLIHWDRPGKLRASIEELLLKSSRP